jgi:hypothetical protein
MSVPLTLLGLVAGPQVLFADEPPGLPRLTHLHVNAPDRIAS